MDEVQSPSSRRNSEAAWSAMEPWAANVGDEEGEPGDGVRDERKVPWSEGRERTTMCV